MNTNQIAILAATGELDNPAEALDYLHRISDSEYRYSDIKCRKQARDSFILEAADVLGADATDRWTLAGRVLQAVERFKCFRWPRIKACGFAALSPSERALYRAFITGAKIPMSQRWYWNLLNIWR